MLANGTAEEEVKSQMLFQLTEIEAMARNLTDEGIYSIETLKDGPLTATKRGIIKTLIENYPSTLNDLLIKSQKNKDFV